MSVYPDNFSQYPWEKPWSFKGTDAQWDEEYNERQALYFKKETDEADADDEEPMDEQRYRRIVKQLEQAIKDIDESLKK